MPRLPPAVLASVLALAACGDGGGGATADVASTTSAVTSAAPDTTGSSTSSSTSSTGSSGDPTTTTTTGEPSTSTTSSSTTSTTTTTGETTTGDASSTTAPDPIEACLAEVDPGNECAACICTDCMALWDACHADEGCAAIQQCAQSSLCYGLDCQAPCESVINLYGLMGGPSWNLWKPMSDCLAATCRPLCAWG
ncbi:hypothetical protein [Nannocystis bainbridge]|uniref:Uncharacterized protein n=1 Tax=Nannocystis bainbridge TaxID=2995303 RepID=A0ABT5DZS6_9BACT|nr:hypothetical protein [Nannocystis bainbridge]MDC0718569.1 hypothetical protein [Nannocystis bainbridge]